MSGIDRHTGQVADNLASALQAVETILSTRIGSRVMRREFGGGIIELLGRLVRPSLFAAFQQLVATSIDLWEPRFLVRRMSVTGTADDLRAGKVGILIEADFRPRGHLGDFTVERVTSFSIFFSAISARVTS